VPEVAIGVSAAHRGQGVGSALIDALKKAIAAADYRAVSLSVEPDNPSRRIYERAGFARRGGTAG
jgi:ribosomal protein S18 acetylase RimI-like enzyme